MSQKMHSPTPKLFVATKAFIINRGRVLIVRDSPRYEEGTNAGKYDVVGGRLSPGERFDESLKREALEEIGLEVVLGWPFFVSEWRPEVRGELWQVVGIFFECRSELDKVTLGEDHDDYRWIEPESYQSYNLIENLYPAFEAYLSLVSDQRAET